MTCIGRRSAATEERTAIPLEWWECSLTYSCRGGEATQTLTHAVGIFDERFSDSEEDERGSFPW